MIFPQRRQPTVARKIHLYLQVFLLPGTGPQVYGLLSHRPPLQDQADLSPRELCRPSGSKPALGI